MPNQESRILRDEEIEAALMEAGEICNTPKKESNHINGRSPGIRMMVADGMSTSRMADIDAYCDEFMDKE